jgi:hypothetical protein
LRCILKVEERHRERRRDLYLQPEAHLKVPLVKPLLQVVVEEAIWLQRERLPSLSQRVQPEDLQESFAISVEESMEPRV